MEYIAELRARHGDQIIARQQKRVLSPRIAADPISVSRGTSYRPTPKSDVFGPEEYRTPHADTPRLCWMLSEKSMGSFRRPRRKPKPPSREEINAKAASSVSIGDADFAITCRTARLAN